MDRISFKSAGAVRQYPQGVFRIRYVNDGASYFGGGTYDDVESALRHARIVGMEAEIVQLRGLANPRNPREVVARFDPKSA